MFNNAGYSLVGTIEEGNADDVRALYDTKFLGRWPDLFVRKGSMVFHK